MKEYRPAESSKRPAEVLISDSHDDIRRQRALVMMPSTMETAQTQEAIRATLDEIGLEVLSWDPKCLTIQSSDLVIADLTEGNPSVMYELGYAHALRKPTILLRSETDEAQIPNDLAGYLYLVYDPSNPHAFRGALKRAITKYAEI